MILGQAMNDKQLALKVAKQCQDLIHAEEFLESRNTTDKSLVVNTKKLVAEPDWNDGWYVEIAEIRGGCSIAVAFDGYLGDRERNFWIGFWTSRPIRIRELLASLPISSRPKQGPLLTGRYTRTMANEVVLLKKEYRHLVGKIPVWESYPGLACFGIYVRKRALAAREGAEFIRSVLGAYFQTEHTRSFASAVESSRRLSRQKRLRLIARSSPVPKRSVVLTTVFARNEHVIAEKLFIANGKCQSCNNKAPFIRRSNGEPFLEVHHKIPLSEGGEDTLSNTIVLCPNCHRKAHFG